MQNDSLFPDEKSRCVFSACRTWRYRLGRVWNPLNKKRILWIMLNPSTADEHKNDPTITRCIGFSKDWGFGGLEVCNIFAYRSTDPIPLYGVSDPVGLENDAYILEALGECDTVVVAFGDHGELNHRGADVIKLIKDHVGEVFCLKKNKSGMPVHPLYQPANSKLIPI